MGIADLGLQGTPHDSCDLKLRRRRPNIFGTSELQVVSFMVYPQRGLWTMGSFEAHQGSGTISNVAACLKATYMSSKRVCGLILPSWDCMKLDHEWYVYPSVFLKERERERCI